MILTLHMEITGYILLSVSIVLVVGLVKFINSNGSKNKLDTPDGVALVSSGLNSLSLSWNVTNNTDEYIIQISEDNVFTEPVGDPGNPTDGDPKISEPTNGYSIDNLQPGVTRYARVKAIGKKFEDSDWSATVTATTDLGDIYLEAECGSIGTAWEVLLDVTATNGKYIASKAGNNSDVSAPTGPQDKCSYNFYTLETGNYRLWIRGWPPGASEDSMWIRWNGGPYVLFNNFQSGLNFHWDEFHDSNNADTPVDMFFGVGLQTIDIAFRDDLMRIDKLFVTKDGIPPTGNGGPATNCIPPADPTDLIITATSTTQLDLVWTKNSTVSNGTILEWSPNGVDTWTQLQNDKLESYSHTALTENTQYFYRVQEYSESGVSAYLTGSQTTLQATQLLAPVLTTFALSISQIQNSWNDVADAFDYRIEFHTDNTFVGAGFSSPLVSDYTHSGLSPGDTRFYRVKARAAGFIDSEWSNIESATTAGAPSQLSTPLNLNAIVLSDTAFDFDWDSTTDAVQYSVDIDDNPSFSSPTNQIISEPTTVISYTGLTAATTYYVRIKAQNSGGGFTDSDFATINATTDPVASAFNVYYVGPTGTNTSLVTNSRTNPASPRFFADGAGYTSLIPGDRVYYRTDQGPYTMAGGFRIYATGTLADPIVYQAEPGGGFAHFQISRFNNNDWLSLERYQNPGGIFTGGEWYWTNEGLGQWNKRLPADSIKGRYCYIIGFAMEGQYKTVVAPEKARDMSQRTDKPYGNTGARAAGTITGEEDGPYDHFSGNIGMGAIGSRVISCLIWHNGQAGSLGASSSIVTGDIISHMNVILGTGHSGPDGKDKGHNGYHQHLSTAAGYFILDGNTYIASCEEQLQCWSQSGIVNQGQPGEYSKVDKIKIIDCVALHGGGMSGVSYPGNTRQNLLFGGYTWEQDSEVIRFLSYKNPGETGHGMHMGYSHNWNNDRRNLHVQDCYVFSDSVPLFAMNCTSIENISGNTLVSRNGQPNVQWQVVDGPNNTAFNASVGNISNNKYYSPVSSSSHVSRQQYAWNGSVYAVTASNIYTLDTWRAAYPTSEVGSTYTQGVPTNFEKVKNNDYIAYSPPITKKKSIVNHEGNATASVTVSTSDGLSPGDKYRIVDLQRIAANGIDNFVSEHTFVGPTSEAKVFTIPDETSGVSGDPNGEMLPYNHSTEEMCHIAIIRVR